MITALLRRTISSFATGPRTFKPVIDTEFNGDADEYSHLSVHHDAGVCLVKTRQRLVKVLWRNARPFQWRKIMKGRWIMVLATALLAGSLAATGAQARGG